MNSTKPIITILFSTILLTGCQRKTSTAIEETQPKNEAVAPSKTKSLEESKSKTEMKKDLSYKESPIQSTGTMQEAALKNYAEKNDYKALYESGYQKHNAGDFQGAIADFNKCISINPEFSDAYNFRGMSKYKAGDKTGACNDWHKAMELGFTQAQNMISNYCK